MILSTAAWQEACILIPNVLEEDCLLVNGIKLSPAERATTLDIMFWELKVPDQENAKKSTYITWRSDRNNPTEFADGKALQRLVSGRIDIYSNSTRSDSSMAALLSLIDQKFTDKDWNVDLDVYEYIENLNRYHFGFELVTIIMG